MRVHVLIEKAEPESTPVPTDANEWESTIYLHGTSKKFDTFKVGGDGLIYFSDPTARPGSKTQAEHIADGPLGGWLAHVKLKKGVKFDPYNDPRAQKIALAIAGQKYVHYSHAPEIVQAATPLGYNRFEFWEDSVQGKSIAVTDPSMIKIVRWENRDEQRTKRIQALRSSK